MTAPALQTYIQGQGVVSADNLNTFEQTCDTIAQLRGFVGTPGLQVFIRGFTSPNDGGGGPFYWNATSTAPDNGNTVVVPAGVVAGAWIRLNIAASQVSGSVGTVTNIAALRASISGTQAIFVEGYFTGADGGEGTFWLNPTDTTSADNGGTIVVDALSHRYYRETSGAIYNARWFGAKGDGSADNTAAMNNAHATGHLIYYPQGTYNFTVLNPFTSGGVIGDGDNISILNSTDTSSADLITFNSGSAVPSFSNFALNAPSTGGLPQKTGGAGISINPSSGQTVRGHYTGVTIAFTPICLNWVAATFQQVVSCNFLGYSVAGVQVQNTFNADSGDNCITGCLFNSGAGAGILHKSGGGLRVLSNKFLGGVNGYAMAWNGISSADLILADNSIENMSGTGITFARASGTGIFVGTQISTNQISNCPSGIATDSNVFLNIMAITGNTVQGNNNGGFCVLLQGVTSFNIDGNLFGPFGGGVPIGIQISAASTAGKIGINNYLNGIVPIVNNSSTTSIAFDLENGSANVTTGSAYGSLFTGTTAITFPRPFLIAPVVSANCTTNGGGGGVSAIVNNVTTTGFNLIAVGISNGGSVPVAWTAQGVL